MKNIGASPGDVQAELMESLRQLFPSWPTPTAVKCLKWRYSQVWFMHSRVVDPERLD